MIKWGFVLRWASLGVAMVCFGIALAVSTMLFSVVLALNLAIVMGLV